MRHNEKIKYTFPRCTMNKQNYSLFHQNDFSTITIRELWKLKCK